jgi:hypothetical protein
MGDELSEFSASSAYKIPIGRKDKQPRHSQPAEQVELRRRVRHQQTIIDLIIGALHVLPTRPQREDLDLALSRHTPDLDFPSPRIVCGSPIMTLLFRFIPDNRYRRDLKLQLLNLLPQR